MLEIKKQTISGSKTITEKTSWQMPPRPTWEQYALMLAQTASLRSQDPYVKVGACALRRDKSVAALGYNGSPRGIEIDWSNREERRKRVVHAEINCLANCKPNEVEILAVTLLPCSSCMTTIAAHGIKKIIYTEIYQRDDFALQLAKEFGISLVQIKNI
jgi:dCMP deaminase